MRFCSDNFKSSKIISLGRLVSTNYLDIVRITLKNQCDHFGDAVSKSTLQITSWVAPQELKRLVQLTKGNLNFVFSLTSDQFFCFQNIPSYIRKLNGLNCVSIVITVEQSAKLCR